MRFADFLRVSVLLLAAAGTALAAAAVLGAARDDDRVLLFVAAGWWALAAAAGAFIGRRLGPSPGVARLLAGARTTTSLPEIEPGAVLFNRLWPLALVTIAAGAVAFLVPQVPAIATGYAILAALALRKQSSAVKAIEERDGVQFFFDKTPPFGAPRLVRTPGFRRIEPVEERNPAAAPH